ncbi:MAG: hypothetical protein J2P30_01640 [Actinobacteria bacterium]|nr:hypothetical protein [Actinomycetota bacterium]
MNGVTGTRRPVLASAYCASERGGNCFTAFPPPSDPNPEGYVLRAAQQHVRDTGHRVTVTGYMITDYEPAEVTA